MKIEGIENVSLVDYPGQVCATIFTGGCNFRCPFCHNSGIVENRYNEYSEEEIFAYLQSRKKLLDAVVVSGGEPTLHRDLPEFIKKIKEMGFLVKLDTNGTNPEMVKRLLEEKTIDYVAMDIKTNYEDYSSLAGVKNAGVDKIKETLRLLHEYGVPYELRTTLVGGLHKKENIQRMAQDLKGEKLLYLQKFKDNEGCFVKGLREVEQKTATEYQKILQKTIKEVKLRGY